MVRTTAWARSRSESALSNRAELAQQAMEERRIGLVTCGTCERTFPDLYPAARCPFEYDHDDPEEDDDPEERGVGEHIILVAFDVYGDTRGEAEEWLYAHLPKPGLQRGLDSWWVAEDDRRDGSDNHSAVFVTPGRKEEAYRLLLAHGLTAEPDYATWTPRARKQREDHQRWMTERG